MMMFLLLTSCCLIKRRSDLRMTEDEMVGFNVGSVYTYNGSDNNRYIYKSIKEKISKEKSFQ